MLDPNQVICGKGIRYLRNRGIEVDLFPTEFMESVEEQNGDFIHHCESLEETTSQEIVSRVGPLINPRFNEDIARLDKVFKVQNVANENTIFIVAGEAIISEMLDRFTCGLLRDAIDAQSSNDPFKRAVIVSAKTWKDANWLTSKSPAISIGGKPVNELSQELLKEAQEKQVSTFPLGTGVGVYLSEPRPRAVLYGPSAEDTKAAVENYIAAPRGLKEFLEKSWR